jgi:hypothetical protein
MERYPECKLHEIGPYIGKVRPILARQLVYDYSQPCQWIWDPFCGSGTIPLEARLQGRHVVGSDVNPYACVLAKAKLHAPQSPATCIPQVALLASIAKARVKRADDKAPDWVRNFFHKKTLSETKALVRECLKRRWYFIAGCLLGILHHQRPGFLSYPASHLVPYLRNNLFPRDQYPEAYEYRDPIPRLNAKIERVLAKPLPQRTTRYRILQKSVLERFLIPRSIDAIITSPPYMNALDYARDNRLRLWFLGIENFKDIKKREIGKISTFESDMAIALRIMADVLKPNGVCVLVLGDVACGNRSYDVPAMILDIINSNGKTLRLENQWSDAIPDRRRSRRNGKATQHERVMIFRKT